MTPPLDFRIRVEAAFPGAAVRRDPSGEWYITPASPLQIDDLLVETFACDYRGRVRACQLVVTSAAIQSVGPGRRHMRDALEQRMQSASAHDLLAARRRLGL